MKKIIVCFAVMMMLVMILAGCGQTEIPDKTDADDMTHFCRIASSYDEDGQLIEYVDVRTRVIYIVSRCYRGIGITPAVNANGEPLIYYGELPEEK